MHQLDAHRTSPDRLLDRKPVRIVRGTIVEAALPLVPGQLPKSVDAVDEFGDFGPSGWSRDALPIVVVGQRGLVCRCRYNCGEGVGEEADGEEGEDLVHGSHRWLAVFWEIRVARPFFFRSDGSWLESFQWLN